MMTTIWTMTIDGTVNSFAQISSDILAEVGTVNSFAQISSDILAEV